MNLKPLLILLVVAVSSTFTLRAQTSLRVIAAADEYADSVQYNPYDSLSYTYFHGRSGTEVANIFGWGYIGNYDTTYTRYYDGTKKYYYVSSRYWQTYDAHNNPLTQHTQYYDTMGKKWNDFNLNTYTYDGSNNMLSYIDQYWDTSGGSAGHWANYSKETASYDASNNKVTDTTFTWITSAWTDYQLTINNYDAHHNITGYTVKSYNSTTSSWDNSQKIINYLNAGYKPDSILTAYWDATHSVWLNSNLDKYTYDGSGNPLFDTSKYWNATTSKWVNSSYTANTYSAGKDLTDQKIFYWSATTWTANTDYIYTYDGNHNPLTKVTQFWNAAHGAFVNSTKGTSTFNSNNQPVTYATTTWDTTTSSWKITYGNQQSHYYYEMYTGVNNPAKLAGNMNIYPSPAANTLSIDIAWAGQQTGIIAIYDINGRQWAQWQTPAGAQYHTSISVSQFPSGNYFISVKANDGALVKQFTVAH